MNRLQIANIDVVVVGSGPGGATVARELAIKGKSVLILERGVAAPLTGSFWHAARALLCPGRSLLITPQLLGMVRGITVGGSSVHYYATCFPIPFEMFKRHGIDLSAEAQEIRNELPVGPLKNEMIGPMARRLMESARDLGYEWRKLDKFMYQDRWDPRFPFGHYGDPYGVKWSARMYVDEALELGAELIDRARVVRILCDGKRAVGVEYRKNGELLQVFAPTIVLAAGGIGTPQILRASGIREAGWNFFFDPLIGVRGSLRDLYVPASEIPMSCGVHMENDGFIMTDMSHPFAMSAVFAAAALRPAQIFRRSRTVQIMVKARDELGGHLTDTEGVKKRLTTIEKRKLAHGFALAKKILSNAGAEGIFKTVYLAAHPGGTAKIGHIVDSNLKTEYDHLYVCDCSVIPESWGLPPTHTILALAKRLSKHLMREGKDDANIGQKDFF